MKFNFKDKIIRRIILTLFLFIALSSCTKETVEESQVETTGIFTDSRDNQTYTWLKIGDQIWMGENLNYASDNGFQQQMTDDNQWNNTTYNGWSYYENDEDNNVYGILYQWEAAKRACPEGWHLPTVQEWNQLKNYLKENAYSFDGVVGNDGIVKSMIAPDLWNLHSTVAAEGSPGNSDYPEVINKSNFSALPSGNRNDDGPFVNLGDGCTWWTSSSDEYSPSRMYFESISWYSATTIPFHNNKAFGFSVRCIKN